MRSLPSVLGKGGYLTTLFAGRDFFAALRVRQVTKEATLVEVEAGDVAVEVGSNVRRMMKPEKGSRAEMIEGSPEEIADKIIGLLKEKGLKKQP